MSSGQNGTEGYKPIPEAIYEATILGVKPGKKAKSSDMVYTEVEFEISNGEFEKRRVWERFAESNASTRAMQVGRSRQQKLLEAVLGNPSAVEAVLSGEKELNVITGKPVKLDLKTNGQFTNVKRFLKF